jgi:hypothetical protein
MATTFPCDSLTVVNNGTAAGNCTASQGGVARPRIAAYCSNQPATNSETTSTLGLVSISVTDEKATQAPAGSDQASNATDPTALAVPLVRCVAQDRVLHFHVLQVESSFAYSRLSRDVPPWSFLDPRTDTGDGSDGISDIQFPANLHFGLGVPTLPLPDDLRVDRYSGALLGSCTQASSTAMVGVVVASSSTQAHADAVINDTFTLDAQGRMWVGNRTVQQGDGVVMGLPGDPDSLVVSEAYWLGVNCFHPHAYNSRPWFGEPFRIIPRLGGHGKSVYSIN